MATTQLDPEITRALDPLPEAIFLVNDEGQIMAANTRAGSLFGVRRADLNGTAFLQLVADADQKRYLDLARQFTSQPISSSPGHLVSLEYVDANDRSFTANTVLSSSELHGETVTWVYIRDSEDAKITLPSDDALELVNATGRLASSTFDLAHDFEKIAKTVRRVIPWDRMTVTLVNDDAPGFAEVTFLAGDQLNDIAVGIPIPLEKLSLSEVISRQTTLEYTPENISDAPETVRSGFKQGFMGAISVPMFRDGEVFGTLAIGTKSPGGYSALHKTLSERLASHLSVAILNQRLRHDLADVASTRANLASLGRQLTSSSDITAAFDNARASIRSLVSYDRLSVFQCDPDARSPKNIFTDGESFPGQELLIDNFMLGGSERLKNLLAADGPLHLDREGISGQDLIEYLSPGASSRYGSVLLVPLKSAQQMSGVMVISRRDDHTYSATEIESISDVVRQVAGPIATSTILEIAESRAEIEAKIADIGSSLASVIQLNEDPEHVLELISDLIPNESFAVNSIMASESEARAIFSSGSLIVPEGFVSTDSTYPLEGTITERTMQSGQTVVAEFETYADLQVEFPGSAPAVSEDIYASFISVPIEVSGRMVGAMTIGSTEPHSFTSEKIAIAERIGQQIGGLVAHTELRLTESGARSEQRILGRIGQLMSSALDLETVWNEFADLTSELVPFSVISMSLVDESRGTAKLAYDYRYENFPDDGRQLGDEFALEGTLTGQVVSEREGIVFVTEDPAEFKKLFPASTHSGPVNLERSMIAVPLVWGDAVVAVLYMRHTAESRFSATHLRLAERVATQISGPVAASLARQREREIAAEREALASITLAMTSGGSLSESFGRLVEIIGRNIEFDDIGLVNLDIARNVVHSNIFWHRGAAPYDVEAIDEQGSVESPIQGTMAEEVFKTRTGILYPCASTAQLRADYPGTPFSDSGADQRSIIYLPVIWDDRIESALWISKSDGSDFSTDNFEFMEKVVARVAGFIAGHRLRERETEIYREQEALIEIGYLASSANDISEIWSQLTNELQKLIPFDRIHIVSIDERTHRATTLHDSWSIAPDPARWLAGDIFDLEGTAAGQVWRTHTGWIHSNGDMELLAKQFPASFTDEISTPLKSFIGQPLSWGGNVYGVLFFSHAEVGVYTDTEFQLSARIAAHIGGSFAGNMLRKSQMEIAEERDGLNQIGTVLNSATDIASAFEEFADRVEKLVSFNSIALSRIYRERNCVIREYDSWRGMEPTGYRPGAVIPLEGSAAAAVGESKLGILVPYGDTAQYMDDFPSAMPEGHDWDKKSSLIVPILWSDEVIAVMSIATANAPGYNQSQLDLANRIAAQIAGPLAGHLLREQEEKREFERATLNSIGALMSLNPHTDEVADEFLDLTSSLISCDVVGLLEIDRANDEIRPVISKYMAHTGVANIWDSVTSTRLSGTITEQVVETRKVIVNTAETKNDLGSSYPNSPGFDQFVPNRTILLAPLLWNDSVNFVLFFRDTSGSGFDHNDVRIAELIAAQIAGPVASEQTRASQAALESERRRRAEAEAEAKLFEEISETKSNFVSAMSHELKTPLTSIVAFSDILSRNRTGVLDPRILQQINIIQRNSRHLESMIDQLLDLSRMESGRFTITRAPFDIAELVTQAVENSAHLWEGKFQQMSLDLAVDSLITNADRERILQVINNLIANASKYSPENTTIEVGLRRIGRSAEFTVADQGPGLPEDSIEKLFEMFYRVENSQAASIPGTGIGLNVSKRIIEEHAGEISVNNRDGGGTIATFSIPLGIA
jgi:signal transduction histidine kinase/putative methionine-R-sulfoxide reductase with GAF domain